MNKSESIKELATALAKFQGEVKNPANTAENPFFKSKYAPLDEILNLVRPTLSKHGLSIVQIPVMSEGMVGVSTTLLHSSGEWIETLPILLKLDKQSAQGAGSAITYARRYALSAILGISSEDDDDGNVAEKQVKTKKTIKKTTPKDTKDITHNELLTELYALVKEKNYQEGVKSYIKKTYNKNSSTELTDIEIKELIELLKAMKV